MTASSKQPMQTFCQRSWLEPLCLLSCAYDDCDDHPCDASATSGVELGAVQQIIDQKSPGISVS